MRERSELKAQLLAALVHNVIPRQTRDGEDIHVSPETARIIADQIKSGSSFTDLEDLQIQSFPPENDGGPV